MRITSGEGFAVLRFGSWLHVQDLPGKPDIVLPKYETVIFIHGCFWHGHEGCRYFVVPKTRTEWWLNKIGTNAANDANAENQLKKCRLENHKNLGMRIKAFKRSGNTFSAYCQFAKIKLHILAEMILRLPFANYSSCFFSASLLGKTALYSLEKICWLSSGKVNSTTVLLPSLQRIIPIVGFSSLAFIFLS